MGYSLYILVDVVAGVVAILLPLFHDDDVALRTTDCIAYSRCGRQL
jgi:hypothetical protein